MITHPRDTPWPRQAREMLSNISYTKVMRFDTEADLLEELLKIVNGTDPDVLIGYDCGFQFDILMHRMFTLKVSNWSRIGRLRRSAPPLIRVQNMRVVFIFIYCFRKLIKSMRFREG